jgi:hypothetical protein
LVLSSPGSPALRAGASILEEGGALKSYRKELWLNVPARMAFVNITPQVEVCLGESGIREGLVLVKTKKTSFLLKSSPSY